MRRQVRVAAVVVLGLLLAGVGASWVRSYWYVDVASCSWGELRKPGEDHEVPGMRTYVSRTLSVSHDLGRVELTLVRQKYIAATQTDVQPRAPRSTFDWWFEPGYETGDSALLGWTYFHDWDEWRALGLGVSKIVVQGATWRSIWVPHWFMTVVLIGTIIRVVIGSRVERRRRRGLCPTCGYDVKGGAACPECGWGKEGVVSSVGGDVGAGA